MSVNLRCPALCSGVTSDAFQKATKPSSPPVMSTLWSCRQNTAFTFPVCAAPTTWNSVAPGG